MERSENIALVVTTGRLSVFGETLGRPLMWAVDSIFLFLSYGDLIGKIFPVTDEFMKKVALFSSLPWYWKVILILTVNILLIGEGSFREIRKRERTISDYQARIAHLFWPEDRPKITFQGWGWIHPPVERILAGLYLANHGSTALEVIVEPIIFGDFRTRSHATPHICNNDSKGVEVWLDGEPEERKWHLDNFLEACWLAARENGKLQEDVLVVLVSAVYRDFNNLWYRTRGELSFQLVHGKGDGVIRLKTLEQEPLGMERPVLA